MTGTVASAQQREGEYSPSKLFDRDQDGGLMPDAQQREGEYSPSKLSTSRSAFTSSTAQQREGEYSPSKSLGL